MGHRAARGVVRGHPWPLGEHTERTSSYSVPIRLRNLYPPAKVRKLLETAKFSARKLQIENPPALTRLEYPYPCQDTTIRVRYPCKRASPLIIYTIVKTPLGEPTESTSAQPDHSRPERALRVLRGSGGWPPSAAPIHHRVLKLLKCLQDSKKIPTFALENPTARPNGPECRKHPERILRKVAHVTTVDQPRRVLPLYPQILSHFFTNPSPSRTPLDKLA